jgi:hypothetical protein
MAGQMPLEQVLTDYQMRVRRTIEIPASTDLIYSAITTVDLGQSRLFRILTPPSGRTRRWNSGTTALDRPPFRLTDLRRHEAMVLADEPGIGIMLGAIARLWSVRPSLQRVPPEYFATVQRPGFVKITATIEASIVDDVRSEAAIEVRFQPLDESALRHFCMGWSFGQLIVQAVQREVLSLTDCRARYLVGSTASDRRPCS